MNQSKSNRSLDKKQKAGMQQQQQENDDELAQAYEGSQGGYPDNLS